MTGRPPAPLHAVGPIDLALRRGEFFAVVGPSGCGKSTLLELIAGLAPATAGSIEFEGRRIEADIPDGIGVVFQEDACFPWLSVEANIAFGLRKVAIAPAAKDKRERDSRIVERVEFGAVTARLWKSLREESLKTIGRA